MDAFFRDIDADLTKSIKDAVPEPELSKVTTNYATSDSASDRLQALVPLLSLTAAKQQNSPSPSYEDWKKILAALALTQSALDDWPAAASSWQKIVDIDDRNTKNDHPDRDLAAMFNLGIKLNYLQRWPEAEQVFVRLLPMLEEVPTLGKSSQQYLGSLSALMLAVGKQGRVEEVRKLYSEHSAITNQRSAAECGSHPELAKTILRDAEHKAREG